MGYSGGVVRSQRWLVAAGVYTLLIYATLPLTPLVWNALWPLLRPYLAGLFVAVGALCAAALAAHAWGVSRRHRLGSLLVLAAVLAAYLVLLRTYYASSVPNEKLHLLEYGTLAYLVLNGARVTRRGGPAFWGAVAVVALVGVADEGIQKVLPNRYFDLRDILGNLIGGALGTAAWLAVSAHSPWRRLQPAG